MWKLLKVQKSGFHGSIPAKKFANFPATKKYLTNVQHMEGPLV